MPAGCALAAEHLIAPTFTSFGTRIPGHTGHGIDCNEVNVVMIKETRASRAG
jgi:hypothetical protein